LKASYSPASLIISYYDSLAFGATWSKLSKPLKLFWINGDSIKVDKYFQVVLVIDGFELPETVFIVDKFVKEVKVQGRTIKLPED